MRSVCAYYKFRRIVTFIKDQVAWNDWEGDISGIKESEDSILRDTNLYQALVNNELQVQRLDIARFMLDDATRSRSSKLIASFSVPGLDYETFMNLTYPPAVLGTC